MDKYTIDLDKLLNDFEYSELREQQNNIVSSNCQNSQSNHQSDGHRYSKAPIISQKHSINNVFHSLNEYLNSDIKSDLNTPSTSLNNEEIHAESEIPIVLVKKVSKDDFPSIQDIFNNISNEETIEISKNTMKTINNNDSNQKFQSIVNDYLPGENSNIMLEDKQLPISINNLNVVITEDKDIVNTKLISINNEPDVNDDIIEDVAVSAASTFSNNESGTKILNLNDDCIEVMILEQPILQSSNQLQQPIIEELQQPIVQELQQPIVQELQQPLVQELHQEIQQPNVQDLNAAADSVAPSAVKQIVKFHDSFELSDTEIENELEELEKEYQSKLQLDNNIEIVKNSDDQSYIEQSVIHSETEIIVNNGTEDNDTVNINEIQDPEASEKEEVNMLRPNSLELNSVQQQQDNLTINLIGDPGSTPYNNVYVSLPENSTSKVPAIDSVSKELLTEPDTEISNSLSPTLSESSSTYDQSNSDSPNTSDSCNDTSLDENTPSSKNVAKINRNINKQLASESGENSERSEANQTENSDYNRVNDNMSWLGKAAPFWTPDSDTLCCLHCNKKFTVIHRRHHCRACGLVLCSKCSNMKCKLQYMDNQEARVCSKCYEILKDIPANNSTSGSASDTSPENHANVDNHTENPRRLNPNNPMDYCSTVPPLQQVSGTPSQPPSVLVPVGVLKRKGSKNRGNKSVMFMDGIRPGCDLTELDTDFNYKQNINNPINVYKLPSDASNSNGNTNSNTNNKKLNLRQKNLPKIDPKTSSYIPPENDGLPPIVNIMKSDVFYADCSNNNSVVEMLKNDIITFAIQRNFHVQVKIINLDCCINKQIWCFTTDGMISVGQDELLILLEFIDNEKFVPKDIFIHLNNIFNDAVKGTSIPELGLSIHPSSNFLESKNHAGFLYIKPTFQCIQNLIIPKEPYLIGILIHRWETPWAKIFPIRLLLRLGAEYRYYPSPIISTRHRESVYVEIGHTIINLLADFRNFSYTIPSVRGLTIHMEDKNTTVSIPMNRYDQVMKALNNSSEHILAFSANFSPKADAHLVCIQDTHGNNENAYTTHAINIHNKPRKVTGASFIILNGALKSSSGLTAKSSIIEDGLMIHILPEQMLKLRNSLKNMKNFKINCGCVNAQSDESVNILWTENDVHFNVGVISSIDNMSLSGIPSIRVHNGRDFICNSGNKMIRWTEVFIIQSGEEVMRTQDPIDISKISESISKATSQALVKYLDLLATNSCTKIGIRATLHIENVSYLAGSNGTKLPPIYMKALDNELIPVLHKITSNFSDHASVILELKFHILNV